MDHADPRVPRRELVGDGAGAVAAAVIHHGDLEIVSETGQDQKGLVDDRGDVMLFVQCGKEERKAV